MLMEKEFGWEVSKWGDDIMYHSTVNEGIRMFAQDEKPFIYFFFMNSLFGCIFNEAEMQKKSG